MNTLRCSHIIHIFAVLHAVIVLLCQWLSLSDEFLLTVATVSMIAIIGIRKGQGLGIIAASVIAGNILGFVIGTYGADWLTGILPLYALHPITSFITTEIIGFGVLLLYNSLGGGILRNMWVPDMLSIVLTIGVLLIIRVIYSKIFGNMLSEEAVNLSLKLILSNSLALIVLICSNIIYIIASHHFKWLSTPIGYIIGITTETVAISSLAAIIIGYNLPFGADIPYEHATFIQLFSIAIIANLLIYAAEVMVFYVYRTRTNIEKEKEKRRLAQYQYNILKQQVNPHFLFNSLNILNGLIEENKNNEACEYVRKLASLYRYMLQNEDEHLVSLSDELKFIGQYVDLLKVRFPNGFSIDIDIDKCHNGRLIVQCSIQVLIENAFKHNIVRAEQPLVISITEENEYIIVRNNLQPRASSTASTKVGLQNISKQYLAAVGKDVIVTKSDRYFEVKLPLI